MVAPGKFTRSSWMNGVAMSVSPMPASETTRILPASGAVAIAGDAIERRTAASRRHSRQPLVTVQSKRQTKDQMRRRGQEQEPAVEHQTQERGVRRKQQHHFDEKRPCHSSPEQAWTPEETDHREKHDAQCRAVREMISPAQRKHEPTRF